jgi:ubiquinone/menaquinone biosynthesis C-methylase UbiE
MVEQIQSEFGRQAVNMSVAPAFNETQTLQRIRVALGQAPIGRALEIACGPGIVAEAIAPLVSELSCLDATPEMLDQAKVRLKKSGLSNVKFHQAFAEDLPFGDAEFDVIISRLSFHHFNDIEAVLAECRRVLRPQGRLVLADVISSANQDESRLHNALEQLRDPTHVHMFSRAEMMEALHAGGFTPFSVEDWTQARNFTEWAKVISVPERTDPLREIMLTFCRAELDPGIQLHQVDGDIQFTHSWLLVIAELIDQTR